MYLAARISAGDFRAGAALMDSISPRSPPTFVASAAFFGGGIFLILAISLIFFFSAIIQCTGGKKEAAPPKVTTKAVTTKKIVAAVKSVTPTPLVAAHNAPTPASSAPVPAAVEHQVPTGADHQAVQPADEGHSGTSSKNTSDDHGGRPKQTPPEMAPTADSTPPPAAAPLPSQQPHVAVNNVEPKSPAQAVPTTFSSVFPSSIAPTRKSGFSRSTVTVESFQLGKKSSIKDKTTANTPHAPKT